MSKLRYKNPTLTEAVFELRFPNDGSWGISSAIKFANSAAKEGFTEVVEPKDASIEFNFSPAGIAPPRIIPNTSRIQTWNPEKNQLWQAGDQLFAANRTVPYIGWGNFRPHIFKGFSLYCQAAKRRSRADRMVLHYLNLIEVGIHDKPEDYIEFLPSKIMFADHIATFSCQSEQLFNDGDKIVAATAGSINHPNENIGIVLNITYIKERPELEENKLSESVEKAHTRIIDAFQKAVTDKQKERMEVI